MAKYTRVFQEGHYYFLTVVTYQRNPILIQNIDLLRDSFRVAKAAFDFKIEAIVILPDHFHLLILPDDPFAYPDIIKQIKRHFSVNCPAHFYQHIQQSSSRRKKGYKPIWQKRFFEHTIRNETDFQKHLDYIHYNPVKHGLVASAKDWKYSTFRKFVEKGIYDKNWVGWVQPTV